MGDVKPRRPLIALLLSICPGLGQQYSGKLLRGIVAYISLVVISWLAAIAYMYTTSRMAGLLLLTVPFLGVAIIAIDAMICAKRQPPDYRLKWFNRGWIYVAVFAGLLVTVNPLMDYLVGKRIVRAFFVTSGSMYPSVYEHDLVVINKLTEPKRGDIVLIAFQKAKKENASKIIKDQILRRIIAEGGDTIEIKGKQVYLNGKLLDEPYASFGKTKSVNAFVSEDYHLPAKTVPPDAYFVLADAREFGFDSRMFGFIQKEEINGVAVKVFWSWNLDGNQFKWERTAINL
ncbi:signal peptidase I [Thiolapillus sp.]